MDFRQMQICELPFMLNVETGNYDVAINDDVISIHISNEMYAASKQGSTTPLIAMIGVHFHIKNFVTTNPEYALIKLRTVIAKNEMCNKFFIPLASDKEAIDTLHSDLISAGNQGELEELARKTYNNFTKIIKTNYLIKTSVKKFLREEFPPENGYKFIETINFIIQKYCIGYSDHFAEEVSLHNICQTTLGGVVQFLYFNDQLISNATLVGKIPPIFRKSWFNHEQVSGISFKDILSNKAPIDHVKMLIIRSRNLLEKGAFRSAIIESSAALEAEISNAIRNKLSLQNRNEQEIDEIMRKNQKFDDRAKKLLYEIIGFRLSDIDNQLWTKTKAYRDQYRHKIAHSESIPTLQEAEEAVNTFSALIDKFRDKLNGV